MFSLLSLKFKRAFTAWSREIFQKKKQYNTFVALVSFSFMSLNSYILSDSLVFAIDLTGLGKTGTSESFISVTIPPRLMLERGKGSSFCYDTNINTFYLISVGYKNSGSPEVDSSTSDLVYAAVGDTTPGGSLKTSSEIEQLPSEKCNSGKKIDLSDVMSSSGKKMQASVLFFEPA